jgi:hypothetical protein
MRHRQARFCVETDRGRVVAMLLGRGAALDYPEACS